MAKYLGVTIRVNGIVVRFTSESIVLLVDRQAVSLGPRLRDSAISSVCAGVRRISLYRQGEIHGVVSLKGGLGNRYAESTELLLESGRDGINGIVVLDSPCIPHDASDNISVNRWDPAVYALILWAMGGNPDRGLVDIGGLSLGGITSHGRRGSNYLNPAIPIHCHRVGVPITIEILLLNGELLAGVLSGDLQVNRIGRWFE